MGKILTFAVAAGLLAAVTQAAPVCTPGTGIWNEGDGGQGDAGNKPNTANNTTGSGSLSEICGNLANPVNDADMYAISIDGSTFTAIAQGTLNNGVSDPTLFLFDSAGHGEDAAYSSGGIAELDLTGLTPGIYYLALAASGQDAQNGSGNSIFGGQTTPVLNYNHSHLAQWSDTGDEAGGGKYKIALTDAGFANLPEPGTFAMVGASLALLGLALRRR